MKKIAITIIVLTSISLFTLLVNSKPRSSSLKPSTDNKVSQNPEKEEVIKVIAENLDTPWALVFLPDNSILVTERKGDIRKIDNSGKLLEKPIATLPQVKEIGEGGLLGIDIHPNFLSNKFVYVYYTYSGNGNQTLNRVSRFKYEGDLLTDEKIILDRIPGAPNHNGGRIKFGPDGNLYIGTGDAEEPSRAQNKNSLAGKILRVDEDGKAPTSNPFGNEIYSYGHRNVQGLAWDDNNNLWSTEHGRSFPISGLDELNLIKPGQNYGWPTIQGEEKSDGMTKPIANSGSSTWAPSGIAFINDVVYFAGLRGQALYKAEISTIVNPNITAFLEKEFGRLRDVVRGPDNMLYITTSNNDGRGNPNKGDDKVLRINPTKL